MDFVSFLPLFVSSSDYSFLRLLRVLRLQRLLTDVETFAEVREALGLSSTFDRSRVEVTLQLARVFSSLFTLLFVVRAPASLTCERGTDDENHAGTSPSGRFAPSTTRAETHTYWNYRPRSYALRFERDEPHRMSLTWFTRRLLV